MWSPAGHPLVHEKENDLVRRHGILGSGRLGRHVSGGLIFALLLALPALLGPSSSLAAQVAPSAAPIAAAAFPASSCQGLVACEGVTGTVGENSCNSDFACFLSSGDIGANSCTGYAACLEATGNVGDNSCASHDSCRQSAGDIGDNSCNTDYGACFGATGNVGTNSWRQQRSLPRLCRRYWRQLVQQLAELLPSGRRPWRQLVQRRRRLP